MPNYAYVCHKCKHRFENHHLMSEPHPEKCPSCEEPYGKEFQQDWSQSNTTSIVYGDPKTVGQQAELNAKRLGKDGVQQLFEESKNKDFSGMLPKKAGIKEKENKLPWFRSGEVPGLPKQEKPLDLKKMDTQEKIDKYIVGE